MSSAERVCSGLEVLAARLFAPLRGLRVGLVTHAAAVDRQLRHARELFAEAVDVDLVALFGPEHGLLGDAQDLIGVSGREDPQLGLRVYSLYGETVESLKPTEEQLRGLDALVIDLQHVGSRYYTFEATMFLCLEAAAQHGLLTVVLDRPNPLGGVQVEGPTVHPGYESFVGLHPLPIRHGMTMGELAQLYRAERRLEGRLQVIPCQGWRRDMEFEQTGLPWVMPSPNMPTLDTAFIYPGQCLLEGTNLSEGRGTTRPFELCGAPWVDATRLCRRLEQADLPGVTFRPAWFRPTFHKFAGQTCGGVQMHVTDRQAFQPVRTSLNLLAVVRELSATGVFLSGSWFDWRQEPYEFVSDRLAIDLLFGSARERLTLEHGRSPAQIIHLWEAEEAAFRHRRQAHLLYS